jgi:hypothetical protein
MAARVSKNAREGKRSGMDVLHCAQAHRLVRVKTVPFKGSARLTWECECTGYKPIENIVSKRQ